MIKMTRFKIEDLDLFKPRDLFVDIVSDMEKNLLNPSIDMFTMKKNGEIVCLTGICHRRLGVGELWLIPSDLVDKYKSEFFKSIFRLIYNFAFPVMGMHRLEIAILVGWDKGVKWAEKLGFTREGIMKAYDLTKQDHYLYARVL
jgi:hypothetical protein